MRLRNIYWPLSVNRNSLIHFVNRVLVDPLKYLKESSRPPFPTSTELILRFIDGGKRYTPKSITLILHEMWKMVWCLWMIFYPHNVHSRMWCYNHTVHTKRRAHILWPYLAAWELAKVFVVSEKSYHAIWIINSIVIITYAPFFTFSENS